MRAPRARACSSSSTTTIVAPSPITNPSRPGVERAARGLGVVVALRDRAHRIEPADADRRDRRLAAARDHHVGAAVADRADRVADRHRGGRAGGRDRARRPAEAVLHRDHRGAHVRDQHRDPERAHAIDALREQVLVREVERLQAADAGRDRRARALAEAVGRDVERRSPRSPRARPRARTGSSDRCAGRACDPWRRSARSS